MVTSMAYIDILKYKRFIDGSNNEFLNFSMQLALENSSRKIYDDISFTDHSFKKFVIKII
jgi:hypothetical protein